MAAPSEKLAAKAERELPAMFRFDTYELGFRADYSGPQEQLLFTKRACRARLTV